MAGNFFGGQFFGGGFFGVLVASTSAPVVEGRGNWKLKKKRKGRVVKFSDLEAREKYAQALAAASIPIVHPRNDPPAQINDDQEDDEVLMVLLSKVLH